MNPSSDLPKPTTPPTPSIPKDDAARIPLAQKPAGPAGAPVVSAPTLGSNVAPGTNIPTQSPKPTLPPNSLSALSSMSSNKIPAGATGSTIPSTPMPQKTVLGQPIPQAIRGEVPPAGMNKSASGMMSPKPVLQASAPTLGSTIKTEAPTIVSKQGGVQAQKTQSGSSSNDPKLAQVKSPIMNFLPFIAGGIVLLVVIVFVLSRFFGAGSSTSVANNQGTTPTTGTTQTVKQRTEVPATKTTIEYWGLWEPSEVMNEVIAAFETENPGIEVNYTKQSAAAYRERLQTAAQGTSGPDVFRFHASWVPMIKSILDPIPASVVPAADFRSKYYPVVSEQLVSAGQYVGLPLMYDGLVLYYNEDILTTASETPPKTWPELRALAVKLTVPSANGIERGGLAIGNATNVEHFSDILATLILQNGGNLADADSVQTRDALLFYTNFQEKDKVWNEALPSSTVAFARGDVAMMFAPSWRAHEIKALNPNLKFATAAMPQLSEDEKVTWASYWAEGISASSKKKTEAAKFLAYLNRDDVLKKFFSDASKVRAFGEIYPKSGLATELEEDKVIGPILSDAIYAKSGYLNSYTHDNGINDQMIAYYKTAIDSLLKSSDIEKIQATLELGVSQVLKQYSVSSK